MNKYQNFGKWIKKVEGAFNLHILEQYSILNFPTRYYGKICKLDWKIMDLKKIQKY